MINRLVDKIVFSEFKYSCKTIIGINGSKERRSNNMFYKIPMVIDRERTLKYYKNSTDIEPIIFGRSMHQYEQNNFFDLDNSVKYLEGDIVLIGYVHFNLGGKIKTPWFYTKVPDENCTLSIHANLFDQILFRNDSYEKLNSLKKYYNPTQYK